MRGARWGFVLDGKGTSRYRCRGYLGQLQEYADPSRSLTGAPALVPSCKLSWLRLLDSPQRIRPATHQSMTPTSTHSAPLAFPHTPSHQVSTFPPSLIWHLQHMLLLLGPSPTILPDVSMQPYLQHPESSSNTSWDNSVAIATSKHLCSAAGNWHRHQPCTGLL